MNTDKSTKSTSAPEASPDAEAIADNLIDSWLWLHDGATGPDAQRNLKRDVAAALTAATMRELEACAQWHIDQAQVFEKAQRDTGVFNRQVEWHRDCAAEILARSAQNKEGK